VDLESLRYLYLRRAVGTALQTVGIRAADRFARAVGRAVFGLNTSGRRRAEQRLAAWIGSETRASRVQEIAAGVYEHSGRFWIEALYARRLLRDRSWRRFVEVKDERSLLKLADSRRGCLIATACLGNVGVLACALGRIFQPIHVVVDMQAHPVLRAWQQDLFSQPGVRVVERTSAASTIPRLMEAGRAVLVIAESERRRGRAVETSFLGRELRLYPTIGRLAAWYDAPVAVMTCTRRDEPFRFDVRLHDVIRHARCEDDDSIVRQVQACLERAVAAKPEQYLWSVPTLAAAAGDSPLASGAIGRNTMRGIQLSRENVVTAC